MDRMQRGAVLTYLMDRLRGNGSWCGETHIQKAVYIAQKVAGLPTGYRFILYKHGPFSFHLRDELTALRADKMIQLELHRGYGPKMVTTEAAGEMQELYSKTLERCREGIELVVGETGKSKVVDLEKLATAVYVRMKEGGNSLSAVEAGRRITALKSHIPHPEAVAAVAEVDKLMQRARAAGLAAA